MIINSKSLHNTDFNLDVNVCPENIAEIISLDCWPEAVYDKFIVRNDKDIKFRADSIVNHYIGSNNKVKFLDYGCGDGSCVDAARSEGIIGYGFDIIKNDSWGNFCYNDFNDVANNGPYDMILLYDVLDHCRDISDIFNKIRSIIHKGSVVKCRLHPWVSKHGGHYYKKLNKAYVHLFLEYDYCEHFVVKTFNPLSYYMKNFYDFGFNIDKMNIRRKSLEFIRNKSLINILNRKYGEHIDLNYVDEVLSIDFIDVDLSVGDTTFFL